MNAPASVTITPVRVADLLAEGERMPVNVHLSWFGELDEPQTEGQLRVRALDPELVWLAHVDESWRPPTV
jgi:hypothetical protein